jgi:ABC-2 type transport system permease protein
MRSLIAFLKKEMMEQSRTGKLVLLGILFTLFGLMSPVIAKLTPLMVEMMAETMAQSGMIVTEVTVTALDCWVQFYKNVPLALIVFVLVESSIFTREFESGSLLLSLTKGLDRYKVVVAKTAVLLTLWTVGYWLCFGITYAYSVYFWDNSIAQHLWLGAVCLWVFGVLIVGLMMLFSTLSGSDTGVLVGTGGVVLVSYLLSMVPKISKYLPTQLMDGTSLVYGKLTPEDYTAALVITAALSAACFIISIPVFNKKSV